MWQFKLGDITIYEKWNRPTLGVFKECLKQWRELHPNTDPYEIYLIGCAAEKWFGECKLETWDIDLAIKGPIHDYEKLAAMMKDAVRIGFENRIFIDIFWISWLYDNSGTVVPYEQIRFYKHTHLENKLGNVLINDLDYDNNAEELPYGLFKFYRNNGSRSLTKVQTRIKDGNYKHIHINLKDIE